MEKNVAKNEVKNITQQIQDVNLEEILSKLTPAQIEKLKQTLLDQTQKAKEYLKSKLSETLNKMKNDMPENFSIALRITFLKEEVKLDEITEQIQTAQSPSKTKISVLFPNNEMKVFNSANQAAYEIAKFLIKNHPETDHIIRKLTRHANQRETLRKLKDALAELNIIVEL